MPAFKCSKCGVVENTATSGYWYRFMDLEKDATPPPPLCSECDPEISKWHGKFDRFKPEDRGLVEGPDGYIYDPKEEYYQRLLREKKESRS